MGRWVTSKGRRIYIPDEGEENPYTSKTKEQRAEIRKNLETGAKIVGLDEGTAKQLAELDKADYMQTKNTKSKNQISKDQDTKEKQIARNKKEAEIRSDKYTDDEHKPTGMGEMKKGEFFKLSNKPNGKVYVKGEYDKSEKAYWCYEYYDVNSGRYFKKGKTVYTGFTF